MHILLLRGPTLTTDRKGETAVMAQQHNWWAYPYAISLLKAGADYRIADNDGWDLVVQIEWRVMPVRQGGPARFEREPALAQPVIDWLTNEGVNWEAARAALADPNVRTTLENLTADYRHRPWLPQRPTLKKRPREENVPRTMLLSVLVVGRAHLGGAAVHISQTQPYFGTRENRPLLDPSRWTEPGDRTNEQFLKPQSPGHDADVRSLETSASSS